MYEIINTSVPNGLIAGTHGFATVAMTKGMPDAIRRRVENFCAYPHRTSAHDATYFTENPVNWFHLMLPGGDHVVGRTAPAEFDYTGRTNRISRTLHFASREMPISGGAYVLTAESSRFCENWHGEPRYLPLDKTTAGRLQLDNRPSGYEPTYWIQMFGADGKAYAQKFAALLEQNMRTSKGIYFKASKADNDGKRLLGLFADLINILPDEIAAQVTFSTFATCVPNGVACHLRGIYDKDRAFETASALRPWVDCENCCVKHPEMLPQPIEKKSNLTTDTRASSVREEASSARPDLRIRRDRTDARESQRGVGRSYRPESTPSQFPKYLMFGGVLFLLVAAVGLYVFEPWKTKSDSGDKYSIAQIQKDKLDSWYCARTNEIAKCQIEFDACETSSAAIRLLELIKEKRRSLQSSLEDEGLSNYHTQLHEVEVKYDALIAGLSSKLDKLKDADRKSQKIAEEKKRKDDEENRKKLASDAKAKEEVEALTRKQAAETKRNEEAQKLAARSLKELSITEVVSSSKTWVDKISDNDKSKLTAEGSIVYFFLTEGCIKKTTGCVKATVKKDPRSNKETRTLVVESPVAKSSKWFVVYIPIIQKVYWQWRPTTEPMQIFAEDDTVNLATTVFGGKNDAFELYQRFQEIIYALSWKMPDGQVGQHLTPNHDLSINQFEANKKKLEDEILACNNKIEATQKEIESSKEELSKADGWCAEMKDYVASYKDLKKKQKEADDDKKDSEKKRITEQMEQLKEDAYAVFSHFSEFERKAKKKRVKGKDKKDETIQYMELNTISAEDCDKTFKQYKDSAEKHIQMLKARIESDRKTKETKERMRKDWQSKYKSYLYSIEVIDERILPEAERKQLLEGKAIDRTVAPSGIGIGEE